MNMIARLALISLLAGAAVPQTSQNWPEWRGAGRHGVLLQAQLPAQWPPAFRQAWSVPVGEGYSSPVVSGGVAFLHSRQDPQEVVTAVDLATGRVKWRDTYAAPINKNGYAATMGKGPNATPLV